MDLPARNDKPKKKPPPRKFCDNCDGKKTSSKLPNTLKLNFLPSLVFDSHETEDCPNNEDETFWASSPHKSFPYLAKFINSEENPFQIAVYFVIFINTIDPYFEIKIGNNLSNE